MSTPIIRADAVSRVLEGEIPVTLVDQVTLDIMPGEFLAITGPSGSGKSSLLYLLGLLDTISKGRIFLNGVDVSDADETTLAEYRLATLGFVFQFHFLLPEFSSVENVALPMRKLGRVTPQQARARAMELLEQLDLGDHAKKLPSQLSGGQRQRVAIARALANDPAVVLADEPTGNLDSHSSERVQALLRSLTTAGKRAVVVVTHDSQFAATADRHISIVDGQLTEPAAHESRP